MGNNTNKLLLGFALAVFILSVPLMPIQAQSETEAGLTPTSPFYFIDIALEKLDLFFTASNERRVEKALFYAEEKIAEISLVQDDAVSVDEATEHYKEYIDGAVKDSSDEPDEGLSNELLENVAYSTGVHQESLGEISEISSAEVREAIERALNVARVKYQDALTEIVDLEEKVEDLKAKVEELEKTDTLIAPISNTDDVWGRPPTCSVTASPTDNGWLLKWSSSDATSAKAAFGAESRKAVALNGSALVDPVVNTGFTFWFEGPHGAKSCSKVISAAENKTCTITASKDRVESSETYTLKWETHNIWSPVMHQMVKAGGKVHVEKSGTLSWKASHNKSDVLESETFQIGVGGIGGTVFTPLCSVKVYIEPAESEPTPPAAAPTCNVTKKPSGSGWSLTWSSTGATHAKAALDGQYTGELAANGSMRVSPSDNSSYVFWFYGGGTMVTCSTVIRPGDTTTVDYDLRSSSESPTCSFTSDSDNRESQLTSISFNGTFDSCVDLCKSSLINKWGYESSGMCRHTDADGYEQKAYLGPYIDPTLPKITGSIDVSSTRYATGDGVTIYGRIYNSTAVDIFVQPDTYANAVDYDTLISYTGKENTAMMPATVTQTSWSATFKNSGITSGGNFRIFLFDHAKKQMIATVTLPIVRIQDQTDPVSVTSFTISESSVNSGDEVTLEWTSNLNSDDIDVRGGGCWVEIYYTSLNTTKSLYNEPVTSGSLTHTPEVSGVYTAGCRSTGKEGTSSQNDSKTVFVDVT